MSALRLDEAKRPFGGGLKETARRRQILGDLEDGEDRIQMVSVPDLLHLEPKLGLDEGSVQELLELSFLGREAAKGLDKALGGPRGEGDWDLELFAKDLFVLDLIRDCFVLVIDGLRYPVNDAFFYQVLSAPPATVEGVTFRQDILRELESDSE
ncbi:MAG: hypothetical protein AAGD06_31360, partial [Acidobacteriota bacterium]